MKTILLILSLTGTLSAQSPFRAIVSGGVPEITENLRGSWFNVEAYNRLGTANEDDLNEKIFVAGELLANFPIKNLGNLAAGGQISVPLAGDFKQITAGVHPWLILGKSDSRNIGILYSGLTYTIIPREKWRTTHKKVELSGGIEYVTHYGKNRLPISWASTVYAEHNNTFQVLSWGTKPRNMWGVDMAVIFTIAVDFGLKFKMHMPHHGLEEIYLGIVVKI